MFWVIVSKVKDNIIIHSSYMILFELLSWLNYVLMIVKCCYVKFVGTVNFFQWFKVPRFVSDVFILGPPDKA